MKNKKCEICKKVFDGGTRAIRCPSCRREYNINWMRDWHKRNYLHELEYRKKYLKTHKFQSSRTYHKWYIKNKRRLMEKKRGLDYRIRNREYVKKYKQNYPKKDYAHQIGNKLPKKSNCEFCGSKSRLERHHPDYNYPNKIVTLCKKCHTKEHFRRSWLWGNRK